LSQERVRPETLIEKDLGLDPAEKRLIVMIVAGHGNQEIRETLGLTKRDLRGRILRVFRKLRVSNRLELILFATYHGIAEDAQPPSAEAVLTQELPAS